METASDVRAHYARRDLLDVIRGGVQTLGKKPDALTPDDLAPVDEFHIGGRKASEEFFDHLQLSRAMHVLDVGCGIGGPARLAASRYGCKVTGIDLTRDYVETGNALSSWLRLDNEVSLRCENALSLPFADETFDAAYMMHVGMNVADKQALFCEVRRILRPGARFGIYDIMRLQDGELSYPMPWASSAETSFVATPAAYRSALEAAGFAAIDERVRRDLAEAFFARLLANAKAGAGPPPLGLHLIMGSDTPQKVRNMVEGGTSGRIGPVELIAQKR